MAARRCSIRFRSRPNAGSLVTIIGANGAGKSTLLNAIMGVLPSTGSVALDDRRIDLLPLEQRVVSGMCLVPERRELFNDLTVEDNLRLGAFRTQARRASARARSRVCAVSEAQGTPRADRRHLVRRRASDARHGARADGKAEAADARRAEPRAGTADRARNLPRAHGAAAIRRHDPVWSSRMRARRCRSPTTPM